MRVAVIQLAYADGEPLPERRDRAADLVRQQEGHDLVILPELWPVTGFDYRRWDGLAEALDLESVGEDGRAGALGGRIGHRDRGPARWASRGVVDVL